ADRGADASHAAGHVRHSLCHVELQSFVGLDVFTVALCRHACDGEFPGRLTPGHRSTVSATPMPPPMHSDAMPRLAFRLAISSSTVTRMRQPEAPIGWPMAIAPPLTLTLLVSQPISLCTAQACAAKASLISSRSRSAGFQPARSSALRAAGTGPMPM